MPTTVAVAGRIETMSEYVAAGSRAIASWSKTYGITDDATPTPIPAASATGSANAGMALHPRPGYDDRSQEHRGRETVESAERLAPRESVREHDVDREQQGVREGKGEARRARPRAARR